MATFFRYGVQVPTSTVEHSEQNLTEDDVHVGPSLQKKNEQGSWFTTRRFKNRAAPQQLRLRPFRTYTLAFAHRMYEWLEEFHPVRLFRSGRVCWALFIWKEQREDVDGGGAKRHKA